MLTQSYRSQAGSLFNQATSVAGSLTSDAGGLFTTVTCELFIRKYYECRLMSNVAVAGSLATVITSEGGKAISLASSVVGEVTSFAGSEYTVATAVLASA